MDFKIHEMKTYTACHVIINSVVVVFQNWLYFVGGCSRQVGS